MFRRELFALAGALAACRKSDPGFEQVLPGEVAGGWRRSQLTAAQNAPDLIRQHSPVASAEAVYTGVGTIRVRAWQMKSETSAFELMQKWRQSDGISAYKGAYFFVAEAAGADRNAVLSFLRELQRTNTVA